MVDFVGRRQELATLERELQKVAAGAGGERPRRCVMLRGRRRVGKSRLVERFAERSGATVKRLEARGLLQRTPHPMHRTLVELRLTDHGREVFQRADARVAKLDTDLAASLTPAETATLKDLLTQVTDIAHKAAVAKVATADR